MIIITIYDDYLPEIENSSNLAFKMTMKIVFKIGAFVRPDKNDNAL
jgi:hypothetical protein